MGKFLACIFFFLSITVSAQTWQVIDTINLPHKITSYSIDDQKQVYVGTTSGNLYRFDRNGDESEFFSAIANFKLSSIAAWNRLKVFLFYQNPQEFYYLDRFNTISNSYDLRDYSDEIITACTPGVDNSLWLLSGSYNELRKYNLASKQLLFATPLNIDTENVTHMRAFQNLVIISDLNEGLYFFDQFGNLLTQLELKGIEHFQVLDNGELLFLTDSGIVTMDPFHPNNYEIIKAPEGAFNGLLKSDMKFFFIKSDQILIYSRL